MAIEARVVADGDDVVIAWRIDAKINDCLGFAIARSAAGAAAEYLTTGVPFTGQPTPAEGTKLPSNVWPVQRFVWTDHDAPDRTDLTYTITAMIGTPGALIAGTTVTTNTVRRQTNSSPGYALYPNRGVVAAPWIEDELERQIAAAPVPKPTPSTQLTNAIGAKDNVLRDDLAGSVLPALRAQFDAATEANEELYLALYELRDEELIQLLISARPRVHLILGNGSFDARSMDPLKLDPNKPAADRLKREGLDVIRRLVPQGHFAHNKSIVFVRDGSPVRVWSGSTNWTSSGLCTQSNHAVVVEDADLATNYLAYWNRLKTAGNGYPPELATTDSTATTTGSPATRAWFAPVIGHVDLADARTLINGAKQGALFLMFRPGNTDTLIDNIKGLHERGLFIRGVVNDDFLGSNTAPTIDFFNSEAAATHGDPEVILPDHLKAAAGGFAAEISAGMILIHSKVIVLDPFGDHPVIMTGSHNLGDKASEMNDDNLLIIENQPGLAAEFAVYIMNVYDHYKWRYELGIRRSAAAGSDPATSSRIWSGLIPSDHWETSSYLAAGTRQAAFWFGEP